jgi:[ribosomal protein S5]-alanine N-acetyltransferase
VTGDAIPQLETARLTLRAPAFQDRRAYQEFYADGDASAFYGGPLPAHEAWNYLARDLGHWHLRGYGKWVVTAKDDGGVVGGCGLHWPDGWPRPELSWWIAPAYRRKGFAKEASGAAIRFGYGTLGWDLVQTHMRDDNIAAQNLVLALGGTIIAREGFPDGHTRNIYALPDVDAEPDAAPDTGR